MKRTLTVLLLAFFACAAIFAGCKGSTDDGGKFYTITYELDGGRIEGEYKNTYKTSEAFELPVPVKENFEFLGWKDGEGNEWKEIAKTTVGNKVFYANWRQIIFGITYELSGGTNDPENPDSYSVRDEDITLKAPVKAGHKFLGWADKDSSEDGYVTVIKSGSTGDRAFVAVWEKTAFSITYELSGGTNNPENPAGYTAESETIILAPATREGYKFLGWVDKASASAGYVTEIPAGSAGDKTFVAAWEKTAFSINYELAGGTNNPENPDSYDKYGEDIELKAPEKEGYEFLGWIEASSSGTEFVTVIKSGSTGDKTFVAQWKKETLPEAEVFSVKYELTYNGESAYAENPSEVADAEIKEGEAFVGLLPNVTPENRLFRFAGWVVIKGEEEIKITAGTVAEKALTGNDGESITLTAKIVRYAFEIEYVLEYNGVTSTAQGHDTADNGTIGNDETFEGKLFGFIPVNEFYKAAGWVAVINGTEREITAETEFSAELVGEDGTIKLYAKAVRYKYLLKYELTYNGIASTVEGKTEIEDGTMEIGESFLKKLPEFAPATEGYASAGWVLNYGGKEEKINAATVLTEDMLESDGITVKVYAKSEFMDEVTIVYNLIDSLLRDYHSNKNGTSISYAKYTDKDNPLTVGKKVTIDNGRIKNGETFAGKLPKIDQPNTGWVYKSNTGAYVYLSEKTTFDMKKAEITNGKIILYACMTEYWIGPY